MVLRNSRPVTIRPRGLSDALDGTNAFPGAMSVLTNLVPSPTTAATWVPRPAAIQMTAFAGFTAPANVNALLQVGTIVYGMIAETSGPYNGKDVPFAYDVDAGAFLTIAIPGGAASLPASPASSGDWTPPTMAVVGTRIIITHPGYTGGANPFFGWLDISSFSSTTITGDTNSTTAITNLSTNVLAAGWKVGMRITGAGIPADTTIKTIASGGLSLVLSQAATASAVGVTFTVTGGTAAIPLYAAGNVNLNPLLAVPTAVAQFNGRAYYAVNTGPANGVAYSDAGNPTEATLATQVLTFSNGLEVTALGGVPFQQTQGGILQALIAFQGDTTMQQITGDPTTSNLAVNSVGIGVGTRAPNTLCQTLLGLAFIAPDGLRIFTFSGVVTEPIGADGEGVCYPFLSAVSPSRMCAAYNQGVMRISVQNGSLAGQPVQEYWYDFKRRSWSGPHTFPAALIVPSQGSENHGFTMVASGVAAKLFRSAVIPSINDTYVENGTQLTWAFSPTLIPDAQDSSQHSMTMATLTAAVSRNATWTVVAKDEQGNTLDQIQLTGPTVADTIWGVFTWGVDLWNGGSVYLFQQPLNWTKALVFKQMTVLITGASALNTLIGNMNFLIARLGYLTQAPYIQPSTPPVPAPSALTSDDGVTLTGDDGTTILLNE